MRGDDFIQKPAKDEEDSYCWIITMCYEGKKSHDDTEKKKKLEDIFPTHLKSVGGEQQRDKKGSRTASVSSVRG